MSFGQENFTNTIAAIKAGIDNQLHTCAQVYISQYGETIADFAVGEFKEGLECTTKTVLPWMSCSKMITAVAFAILQERNLVDFTDKVSSVIPEFAQNGKEEITFENILNHTCGIRLLSLKWDDISWEESIKAICEMPVEKDWQIGKDGGYHIGTSWFILGEAIQRISGMSLQDFIKTEIFTPLEMNHSWIAIPEDIYNSDPNIARFYRTDVNPIRQGLDKYAKAPNKCRPGASCRGPINELGKFMNMLYEGGMAGHARVLSEKTIEHMSEPSRVGVVDKTFMKTIDWGLGFMVDSKQYQDTYPYSFGPGCSEETFGHNGNQSSAAYVDKENELVVCFVFNGLPGEPAHQERLHAMNKAIYEDLDLI
ncbi:MAG: beta-lactamase family protein [Lentisphaeraceae bacterium]|nr:beta-lactamase family protein [Lentisphaeraceae bacterium]